MNTTSTSIQEASKLALEYNEIYTKARETVRAKVLALEALPRTATGRITKANKVLIEACYTETGKLHATAIQQAESVQSMLTNYVEKHNAIRSNPQLISSIMTDSGFDPVSESIKEGLVATTNKIREGNLDYMHVAVRPEDAVYVSRKNSVMFIISFDERKGYYVRYAGKEKYLDCAVGKYVSIDSRDMSLLFSIGSGSVNIASIGEETEEEALSRLNRLITIIETIKRFRIAAPIVPLDSSSLDSVGYFGPRGLSILKCLAEGKAVYSCARNYAKNKTIELQASTETFEGEMALGIVVPNVEDLSLHAKE